MFLFYNVILLILLNQIYSKAIFSDKSNTNIRTNEFKEFRYLPDNYNLLKKLLKKNFDIDEQQSLVDYDNGGEINSNYVNDNNNNNNINNNNINNNNNDESEVLNEPMPMALPKSNNLDLFKNSRPFSKGNKRSFQIQTYYDALMQKDGSILLIPKDVNKNHYFIG
jgi:hypothetical protein